MNKRQITSFSGIVHGGSLRIAGVYLIIGSVWILFSDRVAARFASNQEMFAAISLYKGWGYVLITALLLYWLIQRHTASVRAGELQLQQVLDAMPALISYVDKDRRYQFTNEAYEDWFGENPEGKHMQEVLGQATYQRVSPQVDRVLNGETVSFENETPDRDGGERYFSATYIPDAATNGQVKGFFVLAQDMTERKQAQEELRQWADAFEGCAHGIAIGDPNTNRIVVCNPAFAKLHKSRVEDIVGAAILSLYAPSDHEHVRRSVQKADQIGHARFEARMIRNDRSTFPVQMDVVSVLGEDGEVFHRVTTTQDISERRQAEEKLKESEAKYRTLVEHLPAITYVSDPEQYVGVSYISPQIESLGFDAEAWLADPDLWWRHIHPDDRAHVMPELHRFQDGADRFRTEYRLLLPNGETRWLHDESIRVKDENGKTILKQGFILDITDRKMAEAVLQDSEERYRLVSELTSDYAYRDRVEEDGSIVPEWITDSFTRITGYTLEESSAPGFWQQLVHPEDSNVLFEHIQTVLSGKPDTRETRVITKDGQLTWLRDYSNPIWDADQKRVVGLYGAVQDITEYKQAEQKLTMQARWLEQINDAVISLDENLMITSWNRAAEQIYGWTAEEVIGKKAESVLKTEFFSTTRAKVLRQLQETGEFRAEIAHLRKDGSRIHIETRSVALRDESGHVTGYVSANRDISERKQSEDALRLKDDLLRLTSEMAKVGGWEFDPQTGKGTWTDEVARIHDLDPELETNVEIGLNFYAGESREKVEQAVREAIELARPYDLELQIVTAKGNHKWVRTMALPVVLNGKVAKVQGIFQDITERKKAEEALRESEQRLRRAQEIANLGSWELDLVDNTLTWSDEVYRIFGLQPQEFSATYEDFLEAVHPEDRVAVHAAYSDSIQAGQDSYEIEHRVIKRSSQEVRIVHEKCEHFRNPDGQIIRSVGMVHDITERKEIEKDLQMARAELERKVQERTAALSEANALLQALMDNIPDHIYFKDTQSRFIRNSRSQANLLGLEDPSESVGKTDFDFFPHAAKSFAEEQEVMRSGTPLVDFEEWVVWPGGRETWVSTTKMPLRDSAGQTIGIFGISHDITERKRAEQAIRQLNADLEKKAEQLQAANKELEAFSYSVSHDLRAPLRAIDGYTRILVEDYDSLLDSEGKRLCSVISREARRMGQLIDDLLAFSRLGRKEMYSSRVDMEAMATSVFDELLKGEDRDRIDFQIATLPTMKGDSSLIRQVWVNLLANALKFTSKKERAVIEVGSEQSSDETIYYIRDNGAGFDMEYGNKLFGVFQRLHTESEFSGTGVGLAIVQRIIRRHGGRIWAEGEVEKGATFYFALPRKENLS